MPTPISQQPPTQANFSLPAQPKVLSEIETLIRKTNVNLRAIAKLISQDQELSAIFLRTINSSFYGLQTKIDSVEHAIPLIGLQHTINIVRTAVFKRAISGDRLSLAHSRLLDRSQSIATLCQLIGNHYLPEYLPPDQLQLLGQFHDSGVPVLMQHLPDYCAAINASTQRKWPDILAEDHRCNVDHSEIGYQLAKGWKLPEPVYDAIRHHHRMHEAEEDNRGLIAALHLACHIHASMNRYDDPEWEQVRKAVLAELEIAPENLEEFEHDVKMAYRMQEG